MRIGSLFSGAGGLDMAVEAVFGGRTVWHSEIDKAASKVLAYRFPGVPNLGSITDIDWAAVEPVDVLCGGFPCQDVSAAGKRAGIKEGTRSGLWAVFADAIDALRPQYVIIENVRGLLSATAHRAVESDDPVVGDRSDRPVLRALGAVLGDLSDLGYDARWATVAAASVGAPHRRERVFIVASDTAVGGWDARQSELEGQRRQPVTGPGGDRTATDAKYVRLGWQHVAPRSTQGDQPQTLAGTFGTGTARSSGLDVAVSGDEPGVALLPTPGTMDDREKRTTHAGGNLTLQGAIVGVNPVDVERHSKAGRAVSGDDVALLPTPQSKDGSGGCVEGTLGGKRPSGAHRTISLSTAVHHELLPTPRTSDTNGAGHHGDGGMDLRTTVTLFRTPNASDAQGQNGRPSRASHQPSVGDQVVNLLLPTPAAQDGNGGGRYSSEGHQTTLPGEARLLSTPSASDGAGGKTSRSGCRIDEPLLGGQAREMATAWGKYEPAIWRWEQIVGPAPAPTEPNKNGNPRLSAAFSEWLMGWPAGWVTDPAIGISRNDQLRIVGNGVCTQQAIAALRYLLAVTA